MKALILVPVFNCDSIIQLVLQSLVDQTELPILVVDDGSDVPIQSSHKERLSILRLSQNQGKGVALQKGFQWARERGYSHVLSFDGDGQHKAEDVDKLILQAASQPDAIVIGCRKFDESVPGVSRFGRKFSNFWVWYQTSQNVSDSQSGLRIYPLSLLDEENYFCRRYDFEIEVLVRALWKGAQVIDVDVGVFYPPEDQRISHFNKFWDNLRITGLNVLLIIYSLTFHQRSLLKVVLVGCVSFLSSLIASPLLGLILGLFTCLVLRLNVILFIVVFLVLSMT